MRNAFPIGTHLHIRAMFGAVAQAENTALIVFAPLELHALVRASASRGHAMRLPVLQICLSPEDTVYKIVHTRGDAADIVELQDPPATRLHQRFPQF